MLITLDGPVPLHMHESFGYYELNLDSANAVHVQISDGDARSRPLVTCRVKGHGGVPHDLITKQPNRC